MPTAPEVNESDYLPTSRYIQKRFGGLVNLRKRLGYRDTHLGAGKNRSRIAKQSYRRGRDAELELETELSAYFGKPFVHVERPIGKRRIRLDFYVFAPGGNFGVDVFTASSFKNLITHVNIKLPRYEGFREDLYLVPIGDFHQAQLDNYIKRRKKAFDKNIHLMTLESFRNSNRKRAAFVLPAAKMA